MFGIPLDTDEVTKNLIHKIVDDLREKELEIYESKVEQIAPYEIIIKLYCR